MNVKQLQNLHNTPLWHVIRPLTIFDGRSVLPPLFVSLILTYRCNLNCEFCYQDKTKRETFGDLTLEDVKSIEKNIQKSFFPKPRIHLFGGEPTVNSDFLEIVKFFDENGYSTYITTNGIGIGKYAETLMSLDGLKEINLSLNAVDSNKTLDTLKLLNSFRTHGHPLINLNCPINHTNQDSLFRIAEEAQGSHANCITFQHTTFTERYDVGLDSKLIKEHIKRIKESKFETPVFFLPDIKVYDIDAYYTDKNFPYGKTGCIFPWFILFIQPNGDVIPCDEMDIPMGNALMDRLGKVWNGQKYREFRKNIIKSGVSHLICQRCCHRRYY